MKNTEERREQILRILMGNQKCTFEYLANRLGVSVRTIERDVDFLSTSKPIRIDRGRNGGAYITNKNGFFLPRLSAQESDLLQKIVCDTEQAGVCALTKQEIGLIKDMLEKYSI